ncbi:hypothetical protein LOTGIDRAFT_223198 [Lottia gigantea]|uniref:PNPLA domain-containing protein n=1 Tax=Lottia gigantea TaxID=225164 RepID=V3ZJJ8_LOTGI|nr:hypothetical protein LOTGIDRAFT_223198 [Lottia gigantea]ESO82545.1 hypothetical protein LOTGIDRAFT_223198 [Lottia gigantea]
MKPTDVTTQSVQNVIETQKEGNLLQNIWARAPFRSSKPKPNKQITKPLIQKDFISRAVIDSRTRALVHSIHAAKSISSKITRTEEFCNHLLQHHNSRVIAYKEKVVPDLIAFRKSSDQTLRGMANEALALIGYVPPLKSRGIRILSIDGGGTRGLIPLEIIRQLQALCPDGNILDKFDYICGVSTGALVAGLIFLEKKSVDVAESLYKEFSIQTFSRNRIAGARDLFWNHSWYETKVWEEILKNQIGNKCFIEYSRDPNCPKFSAISTLMNVTKLRNFLFRNYNLPPGVYSNYPGSANNKIWEGIRASSAAPMYFQHFELGDYIHNDGGLLTNNPTFVAIDESKLLWPDEQIQCVISLGTGRYEPNYEFSPKISLTEKAYKVLESATDTEAVHRQCQTLLPPQTYFRFNPYMSEDLQLNEIRPEKIDIMEKDAKMYLRKNRKKMDYAISRLYETRGLRQKGKDLLYGKNLFP